MPEKNGSRKEKEKIVTPSIKNHEQEARLCPRGESENANG